MASPVAEFGGLTVGGTREVGEGRVFSFHDDWVTYVSQWEGSALSDACRTENPSHACYDRHPTNDYQLPQFWYNALGWLSGDRACFAIDDVSIIR